MKFYKLTIAINEATEEVDFISEELFEADPEMEQMAEAAEEAIEEVAPPEDFEHWLRRMIRRKYPVIGHS